MSTAAVVSRTILAVAIATIAVAPAAQSPTPPADPQKQPPIRALANYVRVDAYPTRGGEPVMDLHAEDFELLENGAPQAITAFEHVVVTSGGPQAQRADPVSVSAAEQAAANPRSRVFILFLDTYHVTVEGSWNIREPLIRMIDRVLGPEDLVAMMTPQMAPSQITLARKTRVIEDGLRNGWPWGERFTLHEDEKETFYKSCFPPSEAELRRGEQVSDLARKMIARRRERLTFEALYDLVRYLRDLREERKAIVAVTEGWLRYRPDPSMTAPRGPGDVPGPDPIGVGVGGKIRSRDTVDMAAGASMYDCNTDRLRLAQMDNDEYFRNLIIDTANRSNATFYPIDPRGLPAFDTPLGPDRPPTIQADQVSLRNRLESLRNLASGTDGIAIMNSNDLNGGLKRISDDLTSYYLLGYYSTNTKLDGTYRRLSVKVKRPGVDVRARRGYRAPTEEEVRAARAAAEPPPPSAETSAMDAAMAALARTRADTRFRVNAAPVRGADGAVSRVWIAGELQPPAASDPWARGGGADVEVSAGGAAATARVTLAPGERTFLTSVALPGAATGPIDVRVRLAGTDPDAARLADSIHVPLSEGARQPLLFRRGPTTGNRYLPAATFVFSRTERVRIEFPVGADVRPSGGRLLDRAGQPLAIPVALATRVDETGTAWLTADIALAPLGAGDYVIELSFATAGAERRAITAIRVTR